MLESSVDDCKELFAAFPQLARILGTLVEVGLGYMKIGQPATDAVRRRGAAREALPRARQGRRRGGRSTCSTSRRRGCTSTTSRSSSACCRGSSTRATRCVVIEHNLDVVKCADWVIDLGPEGGRAGGLLVAEGTPEEVAKVSGSYTGRYLARLLRSHRKNGAARTAAQVQAP